MERQMKQLLAIILGALFATVIIIALIYARQQLFTRTEPIILSE